MIDFDKVEVQPKDPSDGHFYVSIAKSGIRMFAAFQLMKGELFIAGGLLIIAEILGVVEELV